MERLQTIENKANTIRLNRQETTQLQNKSLDTHSKEVHTEYALNFGCLKLLNASAYLQIYRKKRKNIMYWIRTNSLDGLCECICQRQLKLPSFPQDRHNWSIFSMAARQCRQAKCQTCKQVIRVTWAGWHG